MDIVVDANILFAVLIKEGITAEIQAEEISPDKDDTLYIALAMKLKCPIWSNDKDLKKQSEVKIYSTKDIIEIL